VGPGKRLPAHPGGPGTLLTPRTDGARFASPANPTGTLLSADQLQTMGDFIRQRGGQFIVDEIYHGLTYVWTPLGPGPGRDIFVVQVFPSIST
jgi:aspartate/methionine/tyrosine aminotransferase